MRRRAAERSTGKRTAAFGAWGSLDAPGAVVDARQSFTVSAWVRGFFMQQTILDKTSWQAAGPTEIGRGKYNGQPADFVNGEIDDVHLTEGIVLNPPQLAAIAAQTHSLDSAPAIDFSKPGPSISPLLCGLMI